VEEGEICILSYNNAEISAAAEHAKRMVEKRRKTLISQNSHLTVAK